MVWQLSQLAELVCRHDSYFIVQHCLCLIVFGDSLWPTQRETSKRVSMIPDHVEWPTNIRRLSRRNCEDSRPHQVHDVEWLTSCKKDNQFMYHVTTEVIALLSLQTSTTLMYYLYYHVYLLSLSFSSVRLFFLKEHLSIDTALALLIF